MPLATVHKSTAASIVPDWVQAEDDGSIPLANVTGVTGTFALIQANGTIGDGPYGATSGDFDAYRFASAHGATYTIDIDAAILGSELNAVIEVYTTGGTLVASNDNETGGGSDPFLTITTSDFETEYVVIVKGFGSTIDDPFDSSSGSSFGVGSKGEYRIFINNVNASTPLIQHGDGSANTLTGTIFGDVLVGRGGSDTLNGGEGDDLFVWGPGDGDDIVNGGNGFDVLEANVSGTFTLRVVGGVAMLGGTDSSLTMLTLSDVEGVDLRGATTFTVENMSGTALTGPVGFWGTGGNDTLNGTAAVNALRAFGEAGDDTLRGGSGNDMLNGGAGFDSLVGGAGDDWYYVDQFDRITETVGNGADRVLASASFALRPADEVETLTTTDDFGTLSIILYGNAFSNVIYGNAGNNRLDGGGGADQMFGLGGDDLLYVDNTGDQVFEVAGEGSDRVLTSVDFTLMPGQEIELFTTTHADFGMPITLIGNEFANQIFGNVGPNTIKGASGDDLLYGDSGNDFIDGGAGVDRAKFAYPRSEYDVRTFADSGVLLTIVAHQGVFHQDGADTLVDVETLIFPNLTTNLAGGQLNHVSNVDGDRFDDVLFQNQTNGQVYFAKMIDGVFQSWGNDTAVLGTDWKAIGSGDVNPGLTGGAETFFQQQSTGTIWYSSLDTGAITWGVVDNAPGLDWKLRAVGDINGDATADAVLQNTVTGAVKFAAMFNGTFQGYELVTDSLSTNWSLIGVGDINQNGRADAVVQNQSTGTIYYFGVANGVQSGGVVSEHLTPDWHAKAVADVTGDGFADVIIQQASTGTTYFADMHNGVFDHWGVVTATVTADWVVQGTADVDNDGFTDVLFQTLAGGGGVNPGTTYYANMGPAGFEGWGDVASSINSDWHVV